MTGLFAAALTLPHVDYTAILPELILLGSMLVILLTSALSPVELPTETYASMSAGAGIASLIASLFLYRDVQARGAFSAVAHSVDIDGFAVFVLVAVSSVVIVAAFLGAGYLRREGFTGPEYYVLALISASGAMLMGSANDLVLIFLSLEILSIPLYVMAGLDHRRGASGEAALKYFVLGAFSSAIFVYGIALTYGATGSTNLTQISAFLAQNVLVHNGVLLGGMALMLVGFGFKVAAVPFHMWAPDVYEGSPTAATGFMASIAKLGGFAALVRVFMSSFSTLSTSWKPILWVLAALTLLLGAVLALVQTNVKRMLAYSSINHAGFMLLGLQASTKAGVSGTLYYLFTYGLIVLASFAIVAAVARRGDADHRLSNYRGLASDNPVLAVTFALLLLAQAGMPFTTGFFAKFYVLEASVKSHSYALAVIAMVSAGIAVFFYLRVVLLMFQGRPSSSAEPVAADFAYSGALTSSSGGLGVLEKAPARVAPARVELSSWTASGLFLCLGATLVFGVWPEQLVNFAHQATLLF